MPIKRREILILVSVWLAGCFLVTGLLTRFYLNMNTEKPEEPPPVATFEIPFEQDNTAKTAYQLALKEAQEWQDDVELVAVSTQWTNATIDGIGKANIWNFRFFSPEHNRIYFVIVIPGEQVVGQAHLYKTDYTPNLIKRENWVIDSSEALLTWANHGGGTFLQRYPGSNVEVLLRQLPHLEKPVWDIIGISADQSQFFYLSIDAETAQIR